MLRGPSCRVFQPAFSDPTCKSCRNGRVDEFRQPAPRKSKYLRRLEDDGAQSDGDDDPSDIRYWSDYSNVLYHPRTPQRLPDVADYENRDGDWSQSMEEFTRYNEVSMEMSHANPVVYRIPGNGSHGEFFPIPGGRV